MKKIITLLMLLIVFYYFSADQQSLRGVRHQSFTQENSSAIDSAAKYSSKPQLKAEATEAASVFGEYEKQSEGLTMRELNAEVTRIDTRLSDFSEMSFSQFSAIELDEFNKPSRKKAVFLKKLIFEKYANQKQMEKL